MSGEPLFYADLADKWTPERLITSIREAAELLASFDSIEIRPRGGMLQLYISGTPIADQRLTS